MRCSKQTQAVSQTITLFAILLFTISSGCCVNKQCGIVGHGGHGGGLLAAAGCGDCCGGCDSHAGGCDSYDLGCTGCSTGCNDCSPGTFPGSCGNCVTGHCGGASGMLLPLLSTKLACGSGCGGIYWGEWISDPPACCDPCNDCGCWVEEPCCNYGGPLGNCWVHLKHKIHAVIHTGIYGYRSKGCCGDSSCGGCDSYDSYGDGEYLEHSEHDEVMMPTPAIKTGYRHRSPHKVVSQRLRRRASYDE